MPMLRSWSASSTGSAPPPAGGSDLPALILLAVFAVLYILTAATVESFGSDTSTYFELARSLRHEHRYWFNFAPHTVYPPGYPLLLAGLMTVVGETFGPLVKLSIPIYFAGLLGLYWLVELYRGRRTALVVTLLGVTSMVGYFWATVGLHSDVPYFTFTIWALLLVEIAHRASTGRRRLIALALAALCASYLILLRSVGITFVAGLALWVAWPSGRAAQAAGPLAARVRRWLPVAALPVVVLAAWTSWTARHASPDQPPDYMQSYAQQILKSDPHQIDSPTISPVQLPGRLARMLPTRAVNAARTVLNVPSFLYLGWYNPLVGVFSLTAALGFLAALRRERSVLDCYMLSYGGLLLLYPFDEGTRYLFPISPFIAMYGIDGLHLLRQWGKDRAARLGGIVGATLRSDPLFSVGRGVLLAAVVAAGLYGMAIGARRNLRPDPTRFTNAVTVQMSSWVMAHTQPNDVIMDDEDAILHRLTGRRTVRFPLFTDPTVITERILAHHVDYVVVVNERPFEYYNPSTMRRFEKVRDLHPRLFVPVHVFDRGTVYRVQQASTAQSPRSPS